MKGKNKLRSMGISDTFGYHGDHNEPMAAALNTHFDLGYLYPSFTVS